MLKITKKTPHTYEVLEDNIPNLQEALILLIKYETELENSILYAKKIDDKEFLDSLESTILYIE